MRRRAAVALVSACLLGTWVKAQGGPPPPLAALDYYEIQQLYARFCHGLDSAADGGRLFANVFTADGVFADGSGKSYEGRDQLAQYALQGPGRKGPTVVTHYTVNVLIDPVPGGAKGRGYLMVAAPPVARGAPPPAATPGRPTNIVIDGGMYVDDLVKTAEGWRIKKRSFVRAGERG